MLRLLRRPRPRRLALALSQSGESEFDEKMDVGGSKGETSSKSSQSASCSSGANGDAGSFECNICLELAQDPIVTLCGHLFCWPCLYRWLRVHNHSDCPVCKALVQEDKLVPLYGRGKSSTDPRSRSIPGLEIPRRPAGQRPETAPPPDVNQFAQPGFGFMGAPMAAARFGNFTFSTGFGLFPSLFGFHMHGFPDGSPYGATTGFPYGFSNGFHGGHAHGHHHASTRSSQDSVLSKYLMLVGILVLVFFLYL